MSIAAVETRSQVKPEVSVHRWLVLFAVIARAKSWKFAYFSFPSKSLLPKKSQASLLRFGACRSALLSARQRRLLDCCCPLLLHREGASPCECVSPGCLSHQRPSHTHSQPASSECVVSIRLLPPLVVLCQGKTANRVLFFRLVSVFELLLDFTAARAAALRRCVPKIEILICDFY